jgi:hypothetical protein
MRVDHDIFYSSFGKSNLQSGEPGSFEKKMSGGGKFYDETDRRCRTVLVSK